ncbi:TetR/AcrR family transcriptional regulator [Geodermatophilus sp. YIM 151500]|uniref:TetR/AcrR family transcriptional regulator n=1 Tax=Geodermatophilus sp. YIM 151500 TaxID=2984531 RepID=UPI0021E395FF|nr:TetR/AcrR family transcriptional regulator [Geodermatophilus sp. YIM 151500]MCV2489055.1 TetR/AcrR family transcriptional regulator [Geodermatophilus sp. YIM 151500]
MTSEQVEPGRVERKRGRRIQEILRTAAELFGERGYDGANLEDVAQRLDVTKGSLYYYFASKDELVTAAIETLGKEWTERLERLSEARDGSPADRLRALIREHVDIAVREYPGVLRLYLVPRNWPEPQRQRIEALRREHNALFRRVVEEGVASGDFTVASVETTLRCMHAAMSQAPLWCSHKKGAALERALDELADALMMLVGVWPESGEPGAGAVRAPRPSRS